MLAVMRARRVVERVGRAQRKCCSQSDEEEERVSGDQMTPYDAESRRREKKQQKDRTDREAASDAARDALAAVDDIGSMG
ncbi:unnamed protein product [Caenorhabditis auriculariae]|uniref:Uncharacterized protein n=1 Tax=Caenorhabditis auriculariae TaxID=2777116 RepID=A0A8S1HL20_9PELO|nr:unnamed protein product [Caenorhabditis auriculariae]